METSSARPYYAIFAVVAIVVAGFILKQEYASNNDSDNPQVAAAKSPNRMLIDSPAGEVPEKIPDWFKRVGYKNLGFESQTDMEGTQAMLEQRGGLTNLTPDQTALIRKDIATKGIPRDLGIDLLNSVRDTKDRQAFVPDVRALYDPKGSNQTFRTITSNWVSSGDKALVQEMADKDKDSSLKEFVRDEIWNIENPAKGGPSGG